MSELGFPEVAIIAMIAGFALIMVVINIIPFWFISKKAGYHPALGLLTAVPLVNLVFYYFLAFAEWPALRKDSPRQF